MASAVCACIVVSGCATSGFDGGSTRPASGSAQWRLEVLNRHAFARCYALAKRAATAQPFGSGPSIYPLSRGYPLAAIGKVKPRGRG